MTEEEHINELQKHGQRDTC